MTRDLWLQRFAEYMVGVSGVQRDEADFEADQSARDQATTFGDDPAYWTAPEAAARVAMGDWRNLLIPKPESARDVDDDASA